MSGRGFAGDDSDTGFSAATNVAVAVSVNAIILAGGRATRMGGGQKADVQIQGRRLLDIVIDNFHQAITVGVNGTFDEVVAGQVVVVAPAEVWVPSGVARVLEDPPFGGPAQGLIAGQQCLERLLGEEKPADTVIGSGRQVVCLLTCDAPLAPLAVPKLLQAWGDEKQLGTTEKRIATPTWDEQPQPFPAVMSTGTFEELCVQGSEVRSVARFLQGPNVQVDIEAELLVNLNDPESVRYFDQAGN